jgi:uncharacterized coiled-coil protein SlyX
MAFLENEAVLERIAARYDEDSSSENFGDFYDDELSLGDSYYDDESYDFDEYYDDDAEFKPFKAIGRGISSAIGAAGRALKGGGRARPVKLQGVKPNLVGTGGISPTSNLAGTLTNQQGQNFQVGLPPNIATKTDIAALKKSIDALNATAKRTTDTVNKNAKETVKLTGEINRIDAKHTKASQAQNQAIARLNSQSTAATQRINAMGGQLSKMDKEFKEFKEQSQFSALLPMLMSSEPKISSITLEPQGDIANSLTEATPYANPTVTFERQDNTMMMMLPLMMSGGFGSGSGGSNSMLPLVMLMAFNR